MGDEVVEIGAFQDEPSAWIARAVLEANGIWAQVVPMFEPRGLPLPVRARLAVRAADAAAAVALLKEPSKPPSA
jgi:hypothetical protein